MNIFFLRASMMGLRQKHIWMDCVNLPIWKQHTYLSIKIFFLQYWILGCFYFISAYIKTTNSMMNNNVYEAFSFKVQKCFIYSYFYKQLRGWGGGSVAKSSWCSCWAPELSPQHIYQVAHNLLGLQLSGTDALFWPMWAIAHMCTQTDSPLPQS